MKYVELHARSAFSFLRGASEPRDLVRQAIKLGMGSLAICDRDGVYGSARMHAAAKKYGLEKACVGAELTLEDGAILPVLVQNRAGYQNLCRLITEAKLRGSKTRSPVRWEELLQYREGLIALTGDEEGILRDPTNAPALDRLVHAFGPGNVFVEIQRHLHRGERWRNDTLAALAGSRGLPLLATNGVLYATPGRRQVLDVFTCIRNHTHLDAAGRLLGANAERHLKSTREMLALFPDLKEAVANTERVAERLEFTLENLGYQFPKYHGLEGEAADAFLRERTMEGGRKRYHGRIPEEVRRQIESELALIKELGFAGYFLIVWDIVEYCRKHDILIQGRGSAANSVVCFCLHITGCDPRKFELMFERFLSAERRAWPDIDLDLPSGDRREQAIQEVYRRYGRHGAAMTANVITYRGRSAMREIGKALNLPPDVIDRFSSLFANGDFPHTLDLPEQLRQAGLPGSHPRALAAHNLYHQIHSLPRHLGQHSGGMIICQNALSSVVPLENASMPGRVVAQWDKDDCDDLGIVKVDLLGLGMMAVMQDAFRLCEKRQGWPADFAAVPPDDQAVYDMLQKADTIGTFQVESRAQMASLPRMKPERFYDIVMQVAIIRPGPIQGGMLEPLYNRRDKKEKVTYLDPRLEKPLARTYGVPLFQEQLLQVAQIMAGFTGGEAEELRRALSFHRSQERMDEVCIKLRAALAERKVPRATADQVVKHIQSFSVYGFPESHAISFALIAYASCWLKAHRAPEFYTCLLNNQPMGFYSSSTLIEDAKARGVKVRPISVPHSDWLCAIEPDDSIRLGLNMVRGMDAAMGRRIEAERRERPFSSLEDFRRRVEPDRPALRVLARIGALNGLVAHRRDGLWKSEFPSRTDDLPGFHLENEERAPLAMMDAFERMEADFAGTGVTTGRHPMALIRGELPDITRAGDLASVPNRQPVRIAGLVICRQRPGTARGIVFVSLEDETGVANAILYPDFFEKNRLTVTQERFLIIEGLLQNDRGTVHIQARRVEALRHGECATPVSHDFR